MLQLAKMFQVTALLIFSVLMAQVIPTEAADEEFKLSFPKLHHTQYINEADSPSFCSESVYKFGQLYCNQSILFLKIGNCATCNEKTKYYPFSNVLISSLVALDTRTIEVCM